MTAQEQKIAEDMRANNASWLAISREIGRSTEIIRRVLDPDFKNRRDQYTAKKTAAIFDDSPILYDTRDTITPEKTRKADDAFALAMRQAIRRGREHAPTECFKDSRPLMAKPVRHDPIQSGCGSPAMMCAAEA